MTTYTEGICGDGAAILRDGVMMTISEVLAALNAAPAPPVVEVTDEVAERVNDEWDRLVMRQDCSPDAACGYDMIAAVQSILGPTLGMVTREEHAREVQAAYRDGVNALRTQSPELVYELWVTSDARKRLGSP
jgi:hypothetical protein